MALFSGPRIVQTDQEAAMIRCEQCRAGFEERHPKARFCSGKCRAAAWQQRRARAQVDRETRALAIVDRCLELLDEALKPR